LARTCSQRLTQRGTGGVTGCANVKPHNLFTVDVPPVSVLETTLGAIEQSFGSATAAFVALQLEYARP